MFAQYMRLNVHVLESNLCVLREARKMLQPDVRNTREWRGPRRQFYRLMLDHHAAARELYLKVNFGG